VPNCLDSLATVNGSYLSMDIKVDGIISESEKNQLKKNNGLIIDNLSSQKIDSQSQNKSNYHQVNIPFEASSWHALV
jgi:hypothetical protein